MRDEAEFELEQDIELEPGHEAGAEPERDPADPIELGAPDEPEGRTPPMDGERSHAQGQPADVSGAAPEAEGADGVRRRHLLRHDSGFYFYGVVRTRGWRGHGETEDVLRVRYRDLDALVRPVPFKLPGMDAPHLQAHQRVVEGIMRRSTILPAPYGVIFRGRRALVKFLEDQYLALDEGLAFLEGHWELRVHATPRGADEATPDLEELAINVYAELRRTARAAIPFPRDERRLLSAAFLVERGAWIEFVNRADDLATAQPLLAFDITGPWPPYDFVRMSA